MTLRTDCSDLSDLSAHPAVTKSCRSCRLAVLAAVGVVAIGAVGYSLKGTGVLHSILLATGIQHASSPPPAPVIIQVPSIVSMTPADASTGFDPASPIVIQLQLPDGPLDAKTVTDDSVGLFRVDTRQRVAASVKIDGTTLRVQPLKPLEANVNYRMEILPGILDVKRVALKQQSMAFFTSSQPIAGVSFKQIPLLSTSGEGYTCLNFGPDGKLYASTHDGKIIRFPVNADGTLGTPEKFTTLIQSEHGPRLVTGFTFDPRSTADHPIIYLTHSEFGFGLTGAVTDFTGKIARLSGPNFEKLETLVFDLPRSARDHATNQPQFGPDGALYIPQASNTATGAPDAYWFMRSEHGLNDSVLRLDVDAMPAGTPPIDAKTPDAGGPFDPQAGDSPLSVFARGLRMPYDLLWHSNGNLYSSINGASSSGATPADPHQPGTAIPYVNLAEHDWFFHVEKDHFYGHPNPTQGHYILNGGNPTAAPDFDEVSDYPVGTKPDPEWTSALYDFGMHVSADGMIEIKNDRFPGLKGKIFVCRYNVGSGLLCLGLGTDGKVNYACGTIPGTENLTGPLDVVEDVRTGNLYVSEYFERDPSQTRITLLRAQSPGESGVSTTAVTTATHRAF